MLSLIFCLRVNWNFAVNYQMVSVMIWMVLFGWWDVMIQENDSKGMELTLI